MAGSLTIDNINGKVISSSPVATESQVIGVGQTWQDVTASRVSGTTYTNSTGKPIMVVAFTSNNNDANITSYVNGVMLNQSATHSQYGGQNCIEFIVPNGATYQVQVSNTSIAKWSELR